MQFNNVGFAKGSVAIFGVGMQIAKGEFGCVLEI